MNLQNYVNMISALIILIGGLVIIFMYRGNLSDQTRVLIGLLVIFYFFLRMGQTILAIKRERRKTRSVLKGTHDTREDGFTGPKSS